MYMGNMGHPTIAQVGVMGIKVCSGLGLFRRALLRKVPFGFQEMPFGP